MTETLPRVARAEPGAVRECLRTYGRLVATMARRMLGPGAEAEDAVQEIFMDLWRSAARFDPTVSSEVVFVTVIARRRLIDMRRQKQRRPSPEPIQVDTRDTASPIDDVAEARLATRALAQLRPDERQVLLLSTCWGLSHQEIADQTGLPLGTVKTHARRSLLKVRALMRGQTYQMQEGEQS